MKATAKEADLDKYYRMVDDFLSDKRVDTFIEHREVAKPNEASPPKR